MTRFLVDSIGRLDLLVWIMVILFFCGSSMLFGGDLSLSFIGAAGVIVEMLIIGISVEIIIDALKKQKGIGTITGFITNGPEAICLVVGLAVGDIIFASSTPLGSNFMNPLLLFIAAMLCSSVTAIIRCKPLYTNLTILITAAFAGSFYFLAPPHYLWWTIGAVAVTIPLFFIRPDEPDPGKVDEDDNDSTKWLIPAILILVGAGYFLDAAVSFAAVNSKAPKGVIGFFVLATLTSWPEFKSCLALLNRGKTLAAILNITVSNITNIWLAAAGIVFYLTTQ